ncbi:alkaline phosphatase family protein [Gammaproteobacteria bacterium]|nr:alkaline phosphatase family protein [Gammaproteobacteria bacterium]
MRKIIYIISVLLFFPIIILASKQQKSSPRLAVIISVDGLRSNHLHAFWNEFGEGGFHKLLSHYYTNTTSCNYESTGSTTDYASLMTGSAPYFHGITANKVYSFFDHDIVSITEDARFEGIESDLSVSARQLKATTLGDVLKLENNESQVYSIALNANHALMLGGHLADGAIWLDNYTGNFATTNYYNKGLPSFAASINAEDFIKRYREHAWYPDKPLQKYHHKPDGKHGTTSMPILYSEDEKLKFSERMKIFKQTPNVNSVIRLAACKAIEENRLGTDSHTDLLCIELNGQINDQAPKATAELEDLYIRLDKELERIINQINTTCGINNTVIVLTSTPSIEGGIHYEKNEKINSGKFKSSSSMALLNSYLMAIYGQNDWVKGYYAGNIFLNRHDIQKNNIKMDEICDYAAQFMLDFQGVQSSYTISRLQYCTGNGHDPIVRMRNSYHKSHSGDIFIKLQPGWQDVDKNGVTQRINTPSNSQIPIAIFGYEIKDSNQSMNYEDIIPTLCTLLTIPLPNASMGKSIPLY